jgi:hypothetical protein
MSDQPIHAKMLSDGQWKTAANGPAFGVLLDDC